MAWPTKPTKKRSRWEEPFHFLRSRHSRVGSPAPLAISTISPHLPLSSLRTVPAAASSAMAFPFLCSYLRHVLRNRWPLVLYAATWTALITATVAVAAFSPEVAFVWAVSPSSSFARPCAFGSVRLPMDAPPGEVVCVPAYLFARSAIDVFIPPLFAVAVVTAAVCVTRAIGLWEDDEDEDPISE